MKKRLIKFRRFFCFFACLTNVLTSGAQVTDEINEVFEKKRSIYFNWDSKATFISNDYAQIKSIKLGFDFGGKTKLGVGYNWYKGTMDYFPVEGNYNEFYLLKYRYVSLFAEHIYFENKRWEASIPVQLGLGLITYENAQKNKLTNTGGVILTYEPSSAIIFKFLRYFGAGGGIGYRLAINTGTNPQKLNYNSPVIFIRTKLYFDVIWRDAKKMMRK